MIEGPRPCPLLLTWVCSRNDAPVLHRVEPFAVTGDPAASFHRLKTLLAAASRTKIVTETEGYVRAVCHTRLGFVDDMECWLDASELVIHVRSASRISLYDFGANRRRVEAVRRRFQDHAERESIASR